MPLIKDHKPAHFGTLDLTAEEHEQVMADVFEKGVKVRQDAYDAVIRWGAKVISPAKARELLALISNEGFAALKAQMPGLAADIMAEVRRG